MLSHPGGVSSAVLERYRSGAVAVANRVRGRAGIPGKACADVLADCGGRSCRVLPAPPSPQSLEAACKLRSLLSGRRSPHRWRPWSSGPMSLKHQVFGESGLVPSFALQPTDEQDGRFSTRRLDLAGQCTKSPC